MFFLFGGNPRGNDINFEFCIGYVSCETNQAFILGERSKSKTWRMDALHQFINRKFKLSRGANQPNVSTFHLGSAFWYVEDSAPKFES